MLLPVAVGTTADRAPLFGLIGLQSNANAYCGQLNSVATSGTAFVVTQAQVLLRVLRLTSGASGGFTITLPTTAQIISALGPTVPTDGSYGQMFSVLNDAVGQTGTLTAGDASTTITGTATIATNTRRDYFITVLSPTTIGIQNIGSASI